MGATIAGWRRYLAQPDVEFTLKGDNAPKGFDIHKEAAPGGVVPNAIMGGLAGMGGDIRDVSSLDLSSMIRGLGGLGMAAMGPGPEAKAGKSLLETGLKAYEKALAKDTTYFPAMQANPKFKQYQDALNAGKITPQEYLGFIKALNSGKLAEYGPGHYGYTKEQWSHFPPHTQKWLTDNPQIVEDPNWDEKNFYNTLANKPKEQIPSPFSAHQWAAMVPEAKKIVLDSPHNFAKLKPHEIDSLLGPGYVPEAKGLSEKDISAALAKNPGASIFDISGVKQPKIKPPKEALQEIAQAHYKQDYNDLPSHIQQMLYDQLYNPSETRAGPVLSIPPPKWGEKGFPWPVGKSAEYAQEGGFTTPAWFGGSTRANYEARPGEPPNPEDYPRKLPFKHDRFYSSDQPKLADMYASYLEEHPDAFYNAGGNRPFLYTEGQVGMPLLLNTKGYREVDAEGKKYGGFHSPIVKPAQAAGAPGVIIRNVWDEPSFTKKLSHPVTDYVTFGPGFSGVRSPFAEFDPAKWHYRDLLAGLSGGALISPMLGGSDAQR